jgi:DNA-binding response OmpR family regulator
VGVPQPIALIVEDDEAIRDALGAVARLAGFTAELAADGLEALRYVQTAERLPEVILLDLMMPLMDGWQFLERRRESFATVPVIVISAKSEPPLPADVQLLRKPVSLESIIEAMRQYWR